MFNFFQKRSFFKRKDMQKVNSGLIVFFDLENWYNSLTYEEKESLRLASINNNRVCIGKEVDNLIEGVVIEEQKENSVFKIPTSWLKILEIRTENKELKKKINREIQRWEGNIDRYFELGEKAGNYWKQGKEIEAFKMGEEQLTWYRKESNRNALRFSLLGVLPKEILGLNVLVSVLKKEGKNEEAQKLKKEVFQQEY